MNSSEIAGRVSAGCRLGKLFRPRVGIEGALPVPDDEGESRAIALVAVDLLPDPFNVAIEGQVPFMGDPFKVKVIASAGVRF